MHPDKFMQRQPAQPEADPVAMAEQLNVLSSIIAGKRKEAVDARASSGIEAVWLACQEAYLGIDDANRHEFSDAQWAKPNSINGPLSRNNAPTDNTRSTAFVRLTSRYVDNASAKLGEILLPIGEKAFEFDATPVPDLVKQLENKTAINHPMTGQAVMQQPQGQPGQPAPEPVPVTVADIAQGEVDKATKCAKAAETRIYDWMVESNYPAEARKVVHDSACVGAGVLKGPFPESKDVRAVSKVPDGIAVQIKRVIAPVVRWTDIWNLFPDESCGENIHDGDYIFERDFLSRKKLKQLKTQSDFGYLADQIDRVIEEGPGKIYAEGGNPSDKKSKKRFEIWYYYGVISRADMECLNSDINLPEDQADVNVIISMVNDTIIRAVMNPLDSGAFPYRVVSWSRRPGHWAGVGVAEQISMPQSLVNASTRALLNNAGLSSGPQIIMDRSGVVPADGSWKLTPNKIWYKTEDSPATDVRAAFFAVLIQSVQVEMMNVIQYGMKLAEESSGIPLVTQGQTGPTTPQTFGQAELQNNNALTWLRSVGYRFDDMVTDPLIRDFYEYLLLDPTVPDEEKGDFSINAHGSIAMVERAIQEQVLMGMLAASANPAFDIDPAKLFAEILKSKRMNPASIQLSKEDKAKRDQQPPPVAPQVEIAKIRAQVEMDKTDKTIQSDQQIAQMENQTAQTRIKVDTDRDTVYVQAEMQRDRQNAELRLRELDMKLQLAQLDYASKNQLKLEDVKGKLADTSMKLTVQKDLTLAGMTSDLHKHHNPQVIQPAAEPAGRAPDGQAFTK